LLGIPAKSWPSRYFVDESHVSPHPLRRLYLTLTALSSLFAAQYAAIKSWIRRIGNFVSCFFAKKLDIRDEKSESEAMPPPVTLPGSRAGTTATVRDRIELGGERLWRLEDFQDLPLAAAVQALSRLARANYLQRLSKGIYYRSSETSFGQSRPNPAAIEKLARDRKSIFPAGLAAASLAGLTTQSSNRGEVATNSMSLPRKLIGTDTVVHTKRPEAWTTLTAMEAAILDILRRGARTSELSPLETVHRLQRLLQEDDRLAHLLRVTSTEPPRVRAMLGALSEQMGTRPDELQRLRDSLNPLSRFDFGLLAILPNALAWQAKKRKTS